MKKKEFEMGSFCFKKNGEVGGPGHEYHSKSIKEILEHVDLVPNPCLELLWTSAGGQSED